MKNNIITEIYDELRERGFDVQMLEILGMIAHQGSYQTSIQFWMDDEDDESWNGVKISSSRIELDNELTLGQKLIICNHFNKESHYCSAYLSDDDDDLFMVSTCIPANCENLVEICADMFEEVINSTEFLVELIMNA